MLCSAEAPAEARMLLAEDPHCPSDVLELLAVDADLRVSERARRNPNWGHESAQALPADGAEQDLEW